MPHDKDRTHWHEPVGHKKAGFGKFSKQPTPYDAFMEEEGIPVFRDIGISKVQNLPLFPWKRMGGRGHFIQLYGTEGKWGCYVVEVPPAGALNVEKHMYEEIFLVVEGRGTTEVWQEGDTKKHVFEWQAGSMFSIPMNALHRIVNGTSSGALLLAGTTAPNVINMINNFGAVFNNPFVFHDRFSGAEDFFKPKDEIEADPVRGLAMRRTNLIPDAMNCDLPLDNRRSPGYRRVEPHMAGNRFYLFVGQHETRHAHRVGLLGKCRGEGSDPSAIDAHIVVGERDDLAARFPDGAVPGPVEPRPRLAYVAHGPVPRDQLASAVVGRGVVDDEDVEELCGILDRSERVETLGEFCGAVAREDGDGHRQRCVGAPPRAGGRQRGQVREMVAGKVRRDCPAVLIPDQPQQLAGGAAGLRRNDHPDRVAVKPHHNPLLSDVARWNSGQRRLEIRTDELHGAAVVGAG